MPARQEYQHVIDVQVHESATLTITNKQINKQNKINKIKEDLAEISK